LTTKGQTEFKMSVEDKEPEKKIRVLTLGDHPMLPSGVGTQTKYVCEALLKSGKFQILSFGGAIKHPDYTPMKVNEYGDDWIVIPVDGYGNQDQIRQHMNSFKPDILWFMTDPRFYEWLWIMEDEIRPSVPLVYYHVWDNGPTPHFNDAFYTSNDHIATISKVTRDIVNEVVPDLPHQYIPHAVRSDIFKPPSEGKEKAFIGSLIKENNLENRFVCFWNNRNARRKQSGSLMFWWKAFCDEVGHDKATLVMHTDVNDQHGQPLEFLASQLDLDQGQVQFSKEKLSPENLAKFYQMADCTINISDAEGFGLATLESLSCGTPIMVTMTGGLQEQVTDGKNWFGVGIEPTSKAIVGSGQVPYIYEDRINQEVFVSSLKKIYDMTPKEREKLGAAGRKHIEKNYNFKDFEKKWVDFMLGVHEYSGSWETRKNYKSWELINL
jgi:glycosyltransferase involved in cell wall biosynthesis